ncbi:MAG: hypothetical protein QOH84_4698 [Kribbellaceae bacterium]|nr:hypothetical protein [Kribbellaceae bacterium]
MQGFLAMFDDIDVFIHPGDEIATLKPPATDPPRPGSPAPSGQAAAAAVTPGGGFVIG